jgi:hypothetical protein
MDCGEMDEDRQAARQAGGRAVKRTRKVRWCFVWMSGADVLESVC